MQLIYLFYCWMDVYNGFLSKDPGHWALAEINQEQCWDKLGTMLSDPLHQRKMGFIFQVWVRGGRTRFCGCILTLWPPLDSQVTAAGSWLWSLTFLRYFKGPWPLGRVCLQATPGTCQPHHSSWPAGSLGEPAQGLSNEMPPTDNQREKAAAAGVALRWMNSLSPGLLWKPNNFSAQVSCSQLRKQRVWNFAWKMPFVEIQPDSHRGEEWAGRFNQKWKVKVFPGGSVVKNPPASAEDAGSSPGPGRCYVLWRN